MQIYKPQTAKPLRLNAKLAAKLAMLRRIPAAKTHRTIQVKTTAMMKAQVTVTIMVHAITTATLLVAIVDGAVIATVAVIATAIVDHAKNANQLLVKMMY